MLFRLAHIKTYSNNTLHNSIEAEEVFPFLVIILISIHLSCILEKRYNVKKKKTIVIRFQQSISEKKYVGGCDCARVSWVVPGMISVRSAVRQALAARLANTASKHRLRHTDKNTVLQERTRCSYVGECWGEGLERRWEMKHSASGNEDAWWNSCLFVVFSEVIHTDLGWISGIWETLVFRSGNCEQFLSPCECQDDEG